ARHGDDEQAVARLNEVTEKYKQSPYNERASYYVARIELTGGKFEEAASAYASYLAKFKKGEHKSEAEYERALALLSSSPKEAKTARERLVAHARGEEAGRLRELIGVASLRAGDKDGAIAIWTELVKSQPLTWAALTSRARLLSINAPAPAFLGVMPPA